MAIDLFCYTSHVKSESEERIKKLITENEDIFSTKFIFSKIREANEVRQEIALEYGLSAHSSFLIRLNEKNAAGEIPKVADMVRNALGKDEVIILFENEKKI